MQGQTNKQTNEQTNKHTHTHECTRTHAHLTKQIQALTQRAYLRWAASPSIQTGIPQVSVTAASSQTEPEPRHSKLAGPPFPEARFGRT